MCGGGGVCGGGGGVCGGGVCVWCVCGGVCTNSVMLFMV